MGACGKSVVGESGMMGVEALWLVVVGVEVMETLGVEILQLGPGEERR